jgi:mannosyltransferase OCH1-like enzyme
VSRHPVSFENIQSIPTEIPLRIFQTWKSKTQLPPLYHSFSHTIKKLHPQYQYDLWDDNDNETFIRQYYPWFLSTYQNYDKHIKRVDAIRYFYLYHFGGVYMDMDYVTLKPLDPLLQGRHLLFGYEDEGHVNIPNAFMASTRHHPFMRFMTLMLPLTKNLPVLHATGPQFLQACLHHWNLLDCVVPFSVLYTHSWNQSSKVSPQHLTDISVWRKIYPDAFGTTVWTFSWK